jgi:hypothetical protein
MSFEDQIWHCSLGEKVYYSNWHAQEPTLSFRDMLHIMTKVREEHEQAEWERYQEDCAYYDEEERRLSAEEAERFEAEEKAADEEEADDERRLYLNELLWSAQIEAERMASYGAPHPPVPGWDDAEEPMGEPIELPDVAPEPELGFIDWGSENNKRLPPLREEPELVAKRRAREALDGEELLAAIEAARHA